MLGVTIFWPKAPFTADEIITIQVCDGKINPLCTTAPLSGTQNNPSSEVKTHLQAELHGVSYLQSKDVACITIYPYK